MWEHRNTDFASEPQLLSTSPESVLQGRPVPMDKEASHRGMRRDVPKWDSLRSEEMTSQNKGQFPARKFPSLSDSHFYPAPPRATDPGASLVHTDLVFLINPSDAEERGREVE